MIDLSTSTDPDLGVAAAVLGDLLPDGDDRCMVVGATARNILSLGLGHGVPERLTRDVDVSIVVASWSELDAFTRGLSRVGRSAHAFRVLGHEVDIVPWGAVENDDRTITWPDGVVMSLVGMREAYEKRVAVVLPGGHRVTVPSVPGLAVLKLMAWSDRGTATSRDAIDLAEILGWQTSGKALESLYGGGAEALVAFEFDVDAAGAFVLGQQMRELLGSSASRVAHVLDGDRVAAHTRAMPRSVLDRSAAVAALAQGLGATVSREGDGNVLDAV